MECQDCNTTNETVEATCCPYEIVVNEVAVPVKLCEDCYENRADEV